MRILGPSAELRVHHRASKFDGDLDRPFPVANGSLSLVLVQARPAVQRQDRCNLDTGRRRGGSQRSDARAIRTRVAEEGQKVVTGRELHVSIAEVGNECGQVLERHRPQHVRIESKLHQSSMDAFQTGSIADPIPQLLKYPRVRSAIANGWSGSQG